MPKTFLKAGTLLCPVPPIMVSCGSMEKPNIITIGWTGIVNTNPPMTYISVRPSRYSYNLIKETGEFAINLTPSSLIRQADLCGVKSGAQIDKFSLTGLTPEKASIISTPLISECPLSLECQVKQIIQLGTHDMFLSQIVAVAVNSEFIDKNGKINLDHASLAAYSHGQYFELGKCIGSFGFSVRKKSLKKRKYNNSRDK